MSKKHQRKSVSRSAALTIPELEQSKAAVLNTLASPHSRRSYGYAIERFIVWYCGEPRLGFNRSVVVRYRSFLESLSLSAATINLHLTAIRRLADEATESGWLSPELVTGIRLVKGVKRLGRKIGNWLSTAFPKALPLESTLSFSDGRIRQLNRSMDKDAFACVFLTHYYAYLFRAMVLPTESNCKGRERG
jgi:hypothetical protein